MLLLLSFRPPPPTVVGAVVPSWVFERRRRYDGLVVVVVVVDLTQRWRPEGVVSTQYSLAIVAGLSDARLWFVANAASDENGFKGSE